MDETSHQQPSKKVQVTDEQTRPQKAQVMDQQTTSEKVQVIDEQTKRHMIRCYFVSLRPMPGSYWLAVGIAVVLGVTVVSKFLAGEAGLFDLVVFGGLLIVGLIQGLLLLYYELTKTPTPRLPTDKEMDTYLDDNLKQLEKRGLTKAGLSESELICESVQVVGPHFWTLAPGDIVWREKDREKMLVTIDKARFFYKRGMDNVIRFTPVRACIISFTDNQVVIYDCAFCLITGQVLRERTEEYFYKDIVSVSCKIEEAPLTMEIPKDGSDSSPNREYLKIWVGEAEYLTITTTAGTSFSMLVRAPNLAQKIGGGYFPTARTEKAIQTLRKVLREKKT